VAARPVVRDKQRSGFWPGIEFLPFVINELFLWLILVGFLVGFLVQRVDGALGAA